MNFVTPKTYKFLLYLCSGVFIRVSFMINQHMIRKWYGIEHITMQNWLLNGWEKTWHFQKLNCIYTCIDQCGSIRLNIRHLIVDDRARWGVARVRWRLREIIPHKFRWDRVVLRKPPLVSLYYLGCPLKHHKTFSILPWIKCISDITDWFDRYGYAFPRWYWRLTGAKGETVCFFSHTHKYA